MRCKKCGKTTWAGCGQHIDSVKAQVPAAQWCPGHDKDPVSADSAATTGSSFFSRLFGK
ncbi:hypothetical protein [Actinomyces sp. B33]|uniref:hypothetical protein n=1 Tax=Actinomyces sp. B33 TaxID=2942131 RepID=UPI003FA4B29D